MSFPRYPKYKDSGVEWLGEVPEHWEVTPLKHLASLKGRLGWQGLRADEYTEDGPFLVTSEHFANDRIEWHRCYHVSRERFEIAPEIQLRPHDLLMMKDGAAMGKLAYVDDLPGRACLNSHLLLFRPRSGHFRNRFLYYVMGGPCFKTYLVRERTGTTFFGISQESIGAFPFVVPPIAEQTRIAAFLDRETAKIDGLVLCHVLILG
jgi:type I restriction enzyme S subunit